MTVAAPDHLDPLRPPPEAIESGKLFTWLRIANAEAVARFLQEDLRFAREALRFAKDALDVALRRIEELERENAKLRGSQ